jgi:glycosyltransferase involved in cell wall biosynthesis
MSQTTKAIGLLVYRNEEELLPSLLSSLEGIVDHLVTIDNGSSDNSTNILKAHTAFPISYEHIPYNGEWTVDKIRQKLLTKGREIGKEISADIFVCLDADEAFSAPFKKTCRQVYSSIKPGQRVTMQWLAMWKSVDHYRDDNSVWSNNFKDFIFRDSPELKFGNHVLHEPRTPVKDEKNGLQLNPKHGAVLHFQFSNWEKFQIKQDWYRIREAKKGVATINIDNRYAITKEDKAAFVSPCPRNWLDGLVLPKITYKPQTTENNWFLKEIKEDVKVYGKELYAQAACQTVQHYLDD